jgi:hypothetical protein
MILVQIEEIQSTTFWVPVFCENEAFRDSQYKAAGNAMSIVCPVCYLKVVSLKKIIRVHANLRRLELKTLDSD